MPNTTTPKPPTTKQLRYLRHLAQTTGTTFTPPKTIGQARAMIDRMKGRQRTSRTEITRERREVVYDMATKRGDAAKVQDRELAGYGSSATWAAPPIEECGPQVVHCKREPYDVYISRCPAPEGARAGSDGRWGNPFKAGRDGTREEVIAKYERWLLNQPELMRQLPELRGKVLGCWCAPKACHGDVLLRLANAPRPKTPTPSASAGGKPSPFLCYKLGSERRTIVVQRIGGKISVGDLPAAGNGGTRHLVVDRTDDLRTCGELDDLIADYIRQAQRLGSIPLGPAEIDRIIQAAA
jgi:hypothetical protein